MPAATRDAVGITFIYSLSMMSYRGSGVADPIFRCASPGGGRLAQLAERQFYTLEAGGSNPSPPTTPSAMTDAT